MSLFECQLKNYVVKEMFHPSIQPYSKNGVIYFSKYVNFGPNLSRPFCSSAFTLSDPERNPLAPFQKKLIFGTGANNNFLHQRQK